MHRRSSPRRPFSLDVPPGETPNIAPMYPYVEGTRLDRRRRHIATGRQKPYQLDPCPVLQICKKASSSRRAYLGGFARRHPHLFDMPIWKLTLTAKSLFPSLTSRFHLRRGVLSASLGPPRGTLLDQSHHLRLVLPTSRATRARTSQYIQRRPSRSGLSAISSLFQSRQCMECVFIFLL